MSTERRRGLPADVLRWWPVSVVVVCVVIPLALDPWGLRPFLPVKSAALIMSVAATALLAALVTLVTPPEREPRGVNRAADGTLILLATAFVLWSLCVPAVTAASRGLHLLGAVSLTTAAGLAALTLVATADNPGWRSRTTAALAAASVVMVLHALLQAAGADPLALLFDAPLQAAGRWRLFTTTGNPNWTGAFLAATAPLVATTIAERPWPGRAVLPLAWILYGVAVVATGSRLALIALVAGAAVWWWARQRCRGARLRPPSWLTKRGIVLIALLVVAVVALGAPHIGEYLPARWRNVDSLYGRLFQYGAAWKLVGDAPWTGHGLGHFQLLLPDGMRQLLSGLSPAWRDRAPAALTNHVHNDFLETTVESGLVGLALLGALWIVAVWRALARCRPAGQEAAVTPRVAAEPADGRAAAALDPGLAACLVTLAVLALGSVPLRTPSTVMLFWVVLALVATGGTARERQPSAASPAGRIAGVAVAAVVATAAFWLGAHLIVANRDAARARDLLAAEDYEGAEQAYDQVLRLCPWDHESGVLLGAVLVARGRPAEAVAVIDQAERWSASREAWLVRAEALRRLGETAQAAEVLEGAIRAVPDFLRAHAALGSLRMELGQPAMAVDAYRRILASRQDTPLAAALKEQARERLADIDGRTGREESSPVRADSRQTPEHGPTRTR